MEDKVSLWKIISIISLILALMIITFLGAKYFIQTQETNTPVGEDSLIEGTEEQNNFDE